MNHKSGTTVAFILMISAICIYCLPKPPSCADVKYGHYYFYPPQESKPYHIIRRDTMQIEIDTKTNDTSYWRVKWLSDCTYTAKYLYGGSAGAEDFKRFLLAHISYMEIRQVTAQYYVFKVALDSLASPQFVVDTIWRAPKH